MSNDILIDKIKEILCKYTKNCIINCYKMNDDYYISLIDESNIYDSKLHPILMVKETYL